MILITAPIHPVFTDTLKSRGIDYQLRPDIQYDELIQLIGEVTGLVVSTRIPIDAPIIEAAHQLQWIGRLGSGMEHINVEAASQKGIRCISSPEGNRRAVAEHALGLLLNIIRRISKSDGEVRRQDWNRIENTGRELSTLHVGIIGYGHTGSTFAAILSQMGARVSAHDKYQKGFGSNDIVEVDLHTIQQECDVISFHLPHSKETLHYADNTFFAGLKQQPIIINTSRGSVIDTDALISALYNDVISGAALDVLENEQLATYKPKEKEMILKLSQHPNVVITPHIAGYTHEAFYKMSMVLLEKLELTI